MTATCFTIGYQERSVEALCAVVSDVGARLLIDIRERAWSHRPEFRKQALMNALKAWGIDYIHIREAGNPFRPTNGAEGTFEECARNYRAYLKTKPQLLRELSALVEDSDVVFFCYERRSAECHRSILTRELQGFLPALEVEDL